MKKLSSKTARYAAEAATLLFGLLLVVVRFAFPENYHWQFWIAPAFFYLYETVFVVLLDRFESMKPQTRVAVLLATRGVKFIGVAALMVTYILAVKTGKNFFLIYTLFYYLVTSVFETMAVAAQNRPADKGVEPKQEE
ncbi:MAG: hypothetical protein SOZ00_00625 [Tidjanibacter sp.]|nr:hypothetical protein [Tidjanibacter sp.]